MNSLMQPTVSSPIARQIETTPVREMVAASLPIAIPFQDFRERKQNSGRKATFQIGHVSLPILLILIESIDR